MHSALPKYAQDSETGGSASQMCIVYVIVSPSIVLQIAAYRSNSPTTPEWE
ncbi:hypothetical protein FOXG_20121 [Fusarium oxysporum f. sp. lycopersici 4287]|uniref:Uncharacterized protein n=2 Tax=Fusarium oxysporum TaxID=5507 RepID=A0A0J9VDA1_FUSO4|nr:hypothetical protein FOXG_20121 [Fusarium oxysporum f. sp. lycopersici 4287]EXK29350.1 hypothetical protein FOMG_14505 [Fusarium oxysporum f. sp. melonis 26406]KNB09000.1 hypothetical protein FOXG_20121 [Fusarium oxysporum f. sp. lycopersici 4287]